MNIFCRLLFLFALVKTETINVDDVFQNINFEAIPQDVVDIIENDISRVSDIDVLINDFIDKIFANIQNLMRNNNMSTIDIPDAHLQFDPAGHLDLRNGTLQDLDTISRREDVHIKYDSLNKKVSLTIPIKFDSLKFFYDNYHAKVLFISISGSVHGSIENIKVNAELSFDFNTYTAFLDHYDMKDSGKVTIKFTGNGVVDWLLNAMTAVVDSFLGQVIVNVLAKLIRGSLREFCDKINEDIANILNN
ncbi:uncharacterized protein LOC130442571 isoform X1 [Diorhabda sublineata]|uniref:uncharacterized protein LOC130442571 isoform X1 n=1 Tax=Diorhabda sublineata TaxID=1163346 RepID=UPI0024E0FE4D|nr:uncharacterized protein LOC130442571 isoform X1 [Diorhabda sublineata]